MGECDGHVVYQAFGSEHVICPFLDSGMHLPRSWQQLLVAFSWKVPLDIGFLDNHQPAMPRLLQVLGERKVIHNVPNLQWHSMKLSIVQSNRKAEEGFTCLSWVQLPVVLKSGRWTEAAIFDRGKLGQRRSRCVAALREGFDDISDMGGKHDKKTGCAMSKKRV